MSQATKNKVPNNEHVEELRRIEKEINQFWESEKIYEIDAPIDGDPKDHYLVTFPFPYMNGRLHLGHLFTVSKAEYAVRYQRMKGKKALFPFGFHCTGMPIKASADKLKRELESGVAVKAETNANLKSKAASKTLVNVSQSDILKHCGVPEEMIPEFADPIKWLHYFPPYGVQDMKVFGAAVDWRRSFITTDVNPYFDNFVKWQFRILKEAGLVKKDKRPTICNPYDKQPCLDHDRSKGEGVLPQEYTLIKMKLVDPLKVDEKFSKCNGADVYLLAATLRPETMIGQTNYWVKPNVEYDVVKAKGFNEYYVAGKRSVQNLIAQEYAEEGDSLFMLSSSKLIGAEVTTPCVDRKIRGFPLEDIIMTKGTGIVTSVPSDAPADYQGILDLRKNKPALEKYNIDPEWLKFEFIKIIKSDKLGDMAAESSIKLVEQDPEFKKKSKAEKLEAAKHIAYLDGFNYGELIIGPFKGMKVKDAKEEMKKKMCDANQALVYYEPENIVIARTSHECVVMKTDQWYLLYGEDKWRDKMREYFESNVNVFHQEIKEKFLKCFEWLSWWACSRQYGLGTRLPFDDQYLIDSLSDSTIYTAFYTISHMLQGDLEGTKPGLANLKPEQVNDEFFDYIFRNGPMPKGIPDETLKKIKREFEYFYPCSCRVSGKDLVTNHLTMWLYNHAAVFDKKYWPEGIRANGFLNLNNAKMSKSEGNFLTLIDAVEKYSVTACRIALADAGDSHSDANFTDDVACNCTTRLMQFISLIENKPKDMRPEIETFFDKLMDANISKTISLADSAYAKMNYKDALKAAFFDLTNAWTDYTNSIEVPVCEKVYNYYIDTFLKIMTPIIPQFTEHVWMKVLKRPTSIVNEKYPEPGTYDSRLFFEERLLTKLVKAIHNRNKSISKKVKNANKIAVFVVKEYTEVQKKCLTVLSKSYDEKSSNFDDSKIQTLISSDEVLSKVNKKDYMGFLNFYKQSVPEFGKFLLELTPVIDQETLFNSNKAYLLRQVPQADEVSIFTSFPSDSQFTQKVFDEAQVYIPTADLCRVD